MLKNLFSSQVRVDLLSLFFLHPESEWYVRELGVKLGAFPGAINLELNNLASIGLVLKRISGKQHYYRVNVNHSIYRELRDIFIKTDGLVGLLQQQLQSLGEHLCFAFIYGSMADGTYGAESDIDMILIGKVRPRDVAPLFSKTRDQLQREINYTVYPLQEIKTKFSNQDHFLTAVLKKPLIFLIGDEHEFRGLVAEWLAESASDKSAGNPESV